MAYQKIFRTKYVDQLIDQVNKGFNLEQYYEDRFNYDENQVLSVPKIFQPDNLCYRMDPKNNCASAIALFEAYPTISALQATDNRLWIYLSIADLFGYVKSKWASSFPDKEDPDRMEKMKTNIRIHWFGLQKDSNSFAPMRHALANLWWSVYISIDRKANTVEDKYKYTKLLFQNETFRTRTATGFLGRNREALYGILDFMVQYPEVFEKSKESIFLEITKFLNCIGGSIELSFMKRDFFLEQLVNNKDRLLNNIGIRPVKTEVPEINSFYSKYDELSSVSVVNEPEYTDYFNIKDTVSSMINKTEIK